MNPVNTSKNAEASATTVRGPSFCINGQFSATTSFNNAVATAAAALSYLAGQGFNGLVVEVESAGLGPAYAEALEKGLATTGVKVQALTRAR